MLDLMTRRDSWVPPVLTFVTCGLYYFYWQFATTDELKRVTGREDLNPMLDLIVTLLCCGLWGIYVQYRNAQVVHQFFEARGQRHEDRSGFVLILHALALFNGFTGLFAMMIVQDELNKLASGPSSF